LAKLYFRYGSVGSAKTLNLLAVAHSYEQQGKRVLVLKPELDTRFGRERIKSRAGLERDADLLVGPQTRLDHKGFSGANCVLVDECQFLSPEVVDQLREVSTELDIPVICYGLRGDFRTELFPGSKRLLELADEISEVKTTCYACNRKAVFNLKLSDGRPTRDGPVIEFGTEETYQPACAKCYGKSFPGLWSGGV
jgi:thymidine kinase